MKARAIALATLLLLLPSSTLNADVATRTRYWDEKARQAYQQGKFESALSFFLAVFEQTPSASAAYNITLAAQQAKRRDLEYAFLQEYLSLEDQDRGRRARVVARLQELKRNLALVRVETDPPAARIILDRQELGDYGLSPRTVVTQPGQHTVHLALDGYRPGSVAISTEKGKEQLVRVSLEPRNGTLQVQSQPPDALVQVEKNGVVIKTAKASEPIVIPMGSYLIRLQADGYQSVESRVMIGENATERVVLTAPRLSPKLGRLLVSADRQEAQVIVDGKILGITQLSTKVPVGTRKVEVQVTGCKKWTGTLVVQEDQTAHANVRMDCGGKP